MIVAELSQVSRVYGGRLIFRDIGWSIQDREKIGLVGPSGVGKTTLLRILAGDAPPDAGAITRRRGATVAYLPQEYAGQPGRPALAELLSAREDVAALEAQLRAVEARIGTASRAEGLEAALLEQDRLLAKFDQLGGLMVENRAEGLLRSLGLEEESWEQPMESLSGGQRKIVGLARCLLAEPDLLLLDEPDNHLDLDRKVLLESVVRGYRGAVVVVSHDRYLLDETVDVIVELDPSKQQGFVLRRWEGNYSAYVLQKELAQLRQQQDFVAQQKEISRLEEAIRRFKMWASQVEDVRHIRQARNKQRQIDRMEKVERPVLERRKMGLHFQSGERGGAKAVELRAVSRAFEDNLVLDRVEATVWNGERVGVVGANGSGKSVLLRLIRGEDAPDDGQVWVGPSVRMGYYAQQHESLDLAQTAIEAIRQVRPMYEGEAVAQLGRFLIPYDATSQPMARLSGGEKSRVQLCRLMLMGANCLLLDEPTNNLDIPSAEVLEQALDAYQGTIIVVSHDRYFLDRLADRIFELRDGRLRQFGGGYSYYAEQVRQDSTEPARTRQPAR